MNIEIDDIDKLVPSLNLDYHGIKLYSRFYAYGKINIRYCKRYIKMINGTLYIYESGINEGKLYICLFYYNDILRQYHCDKIKISDGSISLVQYIPIQGMYIDIYYDNIYYYYFINGESIFRSSKIQYLYKPILNSQRRRRRKRKLDIYNDTNLLLLELWNIIVSYI